MKKSELLKLKGSILSVIATTAMLSGCAKTETKVNKCFHSDNNDIHYHYMCKDPNGNVLVFRDCNEVIDIYYDTENTVRVDCFKERNIFEGGILYDTANEEMLRAEEEAIQNGAIICEEEYECNSGILLKSFHS